MNLKNKTVLVTVFNDFRNDARVQKEVLSLLQNEAKVIILAYGSKNSTETEDFFGAKVIRLKQTAWKWKKGKFIEFVVRGIFEGLNYPANFYHSNDLDSLLIGFFLSRLNKGKLIYDSHELCTETESLANRPKEQKTWLFLEKLLMPFVNETITVCDSIARILQQNYKLKKVWVVRNVPRKITVNLEPSCSPYPFEKTIVYQGILRRGRGLPVLVNLLKFLPENYGLAILGAGDENLVVELKDIAEKNNVSHRVKFYGKIPLSELPNYTKHANLGLALIENICLNYYFALPNKLFEYLMAGIPVLTSNFPEMRKIVNTYKVGLTTNFENLEETAQNIVLLLENPQKLQEIKANCLNASNVFCWEEEEKEFLKAYFQ